MQFATGQEVKKSEPSRVANVTELNKDKQKTNSVVPSRKFRKGEPGNLLAGL